MGILFGLVVWPKAYFLAIFVQERSNVCISCLEAKSLVILVKRGENSSDSSLEYANL